MRTFIRTRKWWLLAGGLLFLLLGWLAYKSWFAKAPVPPLITAEVTRADLEDAVLATGTIQASKLINVGSQASGQVKKLYVQLGDVVEVGQPIADIDDTRQQNDLKDAQAALASARAQKAARQAALSKAQAEYARQKYMFDRDAASRADWQSAQQALAAAQADLKVADAQIQQHAVRAQTAQANVGYTRITSPTAGTVVAIVTDEGQTVNANQTAPTIVKVAQLENMTIQAQISEADVPRVRPGMNAYFTILGEPDQKYPARLSRVEPGPVDMKTYDGTANSNTNKAIYYNGLLDVPNPEGKLRIEMTAQVSIVLAQARNALVIPSGALIQGSGGKRAGASGTGKGQPLADGASAAQAAPSAESRASPARAAGSAPAAANASGAADRPAEPAGRGRLYTVRVATGEKGQEVVQERQVRIGLNNRVQAEVLEGLQEGERVVVGDAAGDKASARLRGPRVI
ncbi:MAG: efflux RND transporter periplasmic adaptor subunit [Brachymonas sp.]|nr:efflux RND transporter periplasmic adaptor subunit [Brachymonas sp.]